MAKTFELVDIDLLLLIEFIDVILDLLSIPAQTMYELVKSIFHTV